VNDAFANKEVTITTSDIFERVSALIEQGRALVVTQANAVLTMTNWRIGKTINEEILGGKRAGYDQQIVATLSPQLTKRYGRGYDKAALHRMVKFAQLFPDEQKVVTLSPQLSWSHFLALLPVRSDEAREFYIQQALSSHMSVRALRNVIGRKGFERQEIANFQISDSDVVPLNSFRDPYLLDFFDLSGAYSEHDLEDAVVRELEDFLLEAGNGWTFVARQKRMPVGGDDFHLDLLFFSRPLRRLIAVDLKLGHFVPAYEGQMKLYLKWLDRYERQPGEEAPIGIILCTEADRDQVELLEMHRDGIVVAEYWTDLPPKAELEKRIQQIYRDARERIARRQLLVGDQAVQEIEQ